MELGAQFLSSDESIIDPLSPPPSSSNQTKKQAFHQSSSSNNGYVHLREHQLLRLTCVVARARPAASLHFPFDIDYRLERNSTTENNDQTFRTILVLTIPVDRRHHQRLFFCQAIQRDSPLHEDQHVRSNTLLMDVACKSLRTSLSLSVVIFNEYSIPAPLLILFYFADEWPIPCLLPFTHSSQFFAWSPYIHSISVHMWNITWGLQSRCSFVVFGRLVNAREVPRRWQKGSPVVY